jgi:hypothetical protein
MSFTFNGNIIADLTMRSISGTPGIAFHRLVFSCDISVYAWQSLDAVVQDLRGDVFVRPSSGLETLLGSVQPDSAYVIDTRETAYQSQLNFFIDLDRRRLEAVEELRKGGDLSFRLVVAGIADAASRHGPRRVHDSGLSLSVNQRTWIDTLKNMQYGQYLLFEIPVPHAEAAGELKRACEYFEKAREQFWIGHYDESVGDCRKALESLSASLGDKEEVKRVKDAYFAKKDQREDMSIRERLLFLREVTKHMTHPAAHGVDPQSQGAYDNRDARLVLAMTAILLAHSIPA